MKKRSFVLVIVLSASLWAGLGPAEAKLGGEVQGVGSGIFPSPPFAGDRFEFDIDARELPTRSGGWEGSFVIKHFDKTGPMVGMVEGKVECAEIDGDVARLSGKIRQGFVPPVAGVAVDPVGHTAAITVFDQSPQDFVRFGVSFFPPHEIAPCAEDGFFIAIDRGGFAVSGS